jgi:hypothetical protein
MRTRLLVLSFSTATALTQACPPRARQALLLHEDNKMALCLSDNASATELAYWCNPGTARTDQNPTLLPHKIGAYHTSASGKQPAWIIYEDPISPERKDHYATMTDDAAADFFKTQSVLRKLPTSLQKQHLLALVSLVPYKPGVAVWRAEHIKVPGSHYTTAGYLPWLIIDHTSYQLPSHQKIYVHHARKIDPNQDNPIANWINEIRQKGRLLGLERPTLDTTITVDYKTRLRLMRLQWRLGCAARGYPSFLCDPLMQAAIILFCGFACTGATYAGYRIYKQKNKPHPLPESHISAELEDALTQAEAEVLPHEKQVSEGNIAPFVLI